MPEGTVVLVHGAGSGPWVFGSWPAAFEDLELVTPDLQAGLDVTEASMDDYARNLEATMHRLPRPLTLCGWSMGGLVAAMAASGTGVDALVLLEPSPPVETQGGDTSVEPRSGSFDPVAAYGAFPAGMRARPESVLARSERKRGVSVPRLEMPTLVVYGDEYPQERGRDIALFYRCQQVYVAGTDHWGLVLDERVPPVVASFVTQALGA